MTDRQRPITRLLTAAALLAIVGACASARAQDDDDDDAPAAANRINQANRLVINQAQYDQWVFGNMGMANAGVARNKLESLLTLNVEELTHTCGLTPAQKKKLLLAGRGDIKRFFDRVEEVRKKYADDRNFNFQQQFQQIWQEIQPLQLTFQAGLFGEGSIYAKTLRATLTSEQVQDHEKAELDRTLYRYWARVDLAMELLNNQVGFSDDQRQKLVKLLHEETKPPRKLGNNEYYVVLYQLGRIPEEKVRPIFEDVQWRYLDRQLAQGRRMAPFLKRQGFVPADEPDAKGEPARPADAKATRKGVELHK